MKFFVFSDNHGSLGQIVEQRHLIGCRGPDCALIILGDGCFNYSGNEYDDRIKNTLDSLGFRVYCVRGNHEMRPEHLPQIRKIYDGDVDGPVYMEDRFPNIRYFTGHDYYWINGLKTIVLNGAYSIDKEYRLMTGRRWFADEQMTDVEKEDAEDLFAGDCVLVLSHTCPIQYQPRDLFLDFIDQSAVDNSMEIWMGEMAEKYNWKHWLFGHYHQDRKIADGVYMMYHTMRPLDEILLLAGEHHG